jgi:hypothetical protein
MVFMEMEIRKRTKDAVQAVPAYILGFLEDL